MTLLGMVRRSLRQHALSSTITIFSVALASGLMLAVFAVAAQSEAAFTGGAIGFDAVLGARGSQLQLVLNTVFHLETSPGNIPWEQYLRMRSEPGVELAIPYAVGDNYRGFRIVGTTEEIFTRFEYQKGRKYRVAPPGRPFDASYQEAVVGSFVAQRAGLTLGATFNPYHGLVFDENARHDEEYLVVGVLEPTNTPADRVIWIPIDGVFRMEGHVLRGTGKDYKPEKTAAIPDEHKEVSAVMLKFRSPLVGANYEHKVNKQGNRFTLAWPIARVMVDLFNKIGWMSRVLTMVAYLVVLVSAAAILAALYNTISERRREFAILRALGARRRTVFAVIVLEAGAIALAGALLGFVVYAAILSLAAAIIRAQTGVVLDVWQYHPVFVLGPLGMTLLGILAGIIPALKAYATDVAENLTPQT